MNWITKIIKAGEKIKTAFHERVSKEEISKSGWQLIDWDYDNSGIIMK